MKKIFLLISVVGLVALTGCVKTTPTPTACTMEAKICPNGSAVGRIGPNCEFTPCPEVR